MTSDVAIGGDLNSYGMEDPLHTLANAGFTSVEPLSGLIPPAYSYLFSGQMGTLDYILVKSAYSGVVKFFETWHVNADEVDGLDYNLDFGRSSTLYNGSIPYRYSDHDPLISTLGLASTSSPTVVPTGAPTSLSTTTPTVSPTLIPTGTPTIIPTTTPTTALTQAPASYALLTEITDPNSTSYVGTAGPGRYVRCQCGSCFILEFYF